MAISKVSARRDEIRPALSTSVFQHIPHVQELIFSYCPHHFPDVLLGTTHWLDSNKVMVRDLAAFQALLLKFAEAFREGGQELEQCRRMLSAIALRHITLMATHDVASQIIIHFKGPTAPDVKTVVNQLYTIKRHLVSAHNVNKSKIELMSMYEGMPKVFKGIFTDPDNWQFPNEIITIFEHIAGVEEGWLLLQIAPLLGESESIKTADDMQRLETKLRGLKLKADHISSSYRTVDRPAILHHFYNLLFHIHYIGLIMQKSHYYCDTGDTYNLTTKDFASIVNDHLFSRALYPEAFELGKAVSNGLNTFNYAKPLDGIHAAQLRCVPYDNFIRNADERHFAYRFLHTMLPKVDETVQTPTAFEALAPDPFLMPSQIGKLLQSIAVPYAKPSAELSFIPRLTKKKTQPPKPKKKKKKDWIASLASAPAKEPEIVKVATAAAPAKSSMLSEIFQAREFNLKTMKFHSHVQKRLNAPKSTGEDREDIWAHGFTQKLDLFIGLPQYCYKEVRENETHYAFIVAVEDKEVATAGPKTQTYMATYTIVEGGLCIHRCLQKLSLFKAFNAIAKREVFNLIEFPPLSASSAKPTDRIEESDLDLEIDPVTKIVTARDKRHNVLFKILPRPA